MKEYDSIVIGGGINGLLIAALLVNSGERVLVLEKSGSAGGRCRVEKREGFALDNGIHLIRSGRKSVFARIFRELGHGIELIEIGASYFRSDDEKIYLFPSGIGGIFRSRMFSLKDRLKLIKMLLAIRSGRYPLDMDENLSELMKRERIESGTGLSRYFTLLSTTLMVCPNPDIVSSGAMFECIGGILAARVPASYPEAGWARIIEILERTIRLNGEILFDSKVSEIIVENGKATGVMTDLTGFKGKKVIVATTSGEAYELLNSIGLVEKEYLSLLDSLVPTTGITLDYALTKKVSDTKGLWLLDKPRSLGFFVSNLSPMTAPQGGQLYTHFVPLVHGEETDRSFIDEIVASVDKSLYSLFRGMEESLLFKRRRFLKLVDGVVVSPGQVETKRPGNKVPGIKKLFLVGDYVAAKGSGGDIGYNSVWNLVRLLTSED